MSYDSGFSVYEVDETSQVTDMMGASSQMNQMGSWRTSPARSLVILWFVILAGYWFLGYFFKGQRRK